MSIVSHSYNDNPLWHILTTKRPKGTSKYSMLHKSLQKCPNILSMFSTSLKCLSNKRLPNIITILTKILSIKASLKEIPCRNLKTKIPLSKFLNFSASPQQQQAVFMLMGFLLMPLKGKWPIFSDHFLATFRQG